MINLNCTYGDVVSRASENKLAALNCVSVGDIKVLTKARVHESTGPAAIAMALVIGAVCKGPIFWIGLARDTQSLRARGVDQYFESGRLITIQAANRREILWASEEALRCKGVNLVVTQIDMGPDLFESRRLQVASQCGVGLGLNVISRRAQSSAAQTRWHCAPDPTGKANWIWELTKNKRGQIGHWSVNWKDKETRQNATLEPFDLQAAVVSPGFAETKLISPSTLSTARPLETA
ncbi:hypothetical protein N9M10_02000 [Hellea sp.]|nr:hypothetical protein [Hellea sp.]